MPEIAQVGKVYLLLIVPPNTSRTLKLFFTQVRGLNQDFATP